MATSTERGSDKGPRHTGWRVFAGDVGKIVRVYLGNMQATAGGAGQDIAVFDGSTASSATGIQFKAAAAGAGFAVSTLSTGTNENLTIDAKGSGTLTLNGTATGGVAIGSKLSSYNGITSAGLGQPVIVAATSQKAETNAADASVLVYTPPAATGTYRLTVAASITSATSGVVGFTVAYHDASATTVGDTAFGIWQLGTAAPANTFTTSATHDYYGVVLLDVDNSASAITVKWVGGGTLAGFASAYLERIA